MGFLGSLASFATGAAIGAAGGVISGRLLAPSSGDTTRLSLQHRKSEITAAGELAREMEERKLEQQYRATVANRAPALESK